VTFHGLASVVEFP